MVDIGFLDRALGMLAELEKEQPEVYNEFDNAHSIDEFTELQEQDDGTVLMWPSRLLLDFLGKTGKIVEGG